MTAEATTTTTTTTTLTGKPARIFLEEARKLLASDVPDFDLTIIPRDGEPVPHYNRTQLTEIVKEADGRPLILKH